MGGGLGDRPLPEHADLAIPKARYGLLMAGVTLAGLAAAYGLGLWLDGGSATIALSALLAVAAGSVFSFAPALLTIGREHWGIGVVVAGMIRNLTVLGVAYGLQSADPELKIRAFHIAAMGGAVVVLILESLLAVRVLSALDKRRLELAASRA